MRGITAAAVAASLLGVTTAALEPVTIKGNAFFVGDKRFYIRGVDYQPGGQANLIDPLGNPSICKRDIPYFKELGINTIRVYTIDNSADHDECMKLLDEAGIYLVLDVNDPNRSIHRDDPAPSYNPTYLQHVFATIDVFGKYSNTLAFFSGNEIINDEKTTGAAVYAKAVLRDMKTYISKHLDRQIPVGYSAADISESRLQQMQYFDCGDDPMARQDFFAFNDYSWCGESSFQQSGWAQKVEDYKNLTIPLFLSEYGCNEVPDGHRPFTEVRALYSEPMTHVFSGGLVYEYTQEDNDYGLVEIKNGKITKLSDFTALKEQFAAVDNPSGDGDYIAERKYAKECPRVEKGVWEAKEELPALPKGAQKFMDDGAGTPRGSPTINPGDPVHDTPAAPEDEPEEPADGEDGEGGEGDDENAGEGRRITWTLFGIVGVAAGMLVL